MSSENKDASAPPPYPGGPTPYPPAQQTPYPPPTQQVYQPPVQQPYPQTTPGNVYAVQQQPQPVTTVVVTGRGNCPNCRVGHIVEEFTCCGIVMAILFFPIGLLCCLLMRQRVCTNCHSVF